MNRKSFAVVLIGIAWLSGSAFIGSTLSDTWTFHHILVIGHMVLGTAVACVGFSIR